MGGASRACTREFRPTLLACIPISLPGERRASDSIAQASPQSQEREKNTILGSYLENVKEAVQEACSACPGVNAGDLVEALSQLRRWADTRSAAARKVRVSANCAHMHSHPLSLPHAPPRNTSTTPTSTTPSHPPPHPHEKTRTATQYKGMVRELDEKVKLLTMAAEEQRKDNELLRRRLASSEGAARDAAEAKEEAERALQARVRDLEGRLRAAESAAEEAQLRWRRASGRAEELAGTVESLKDRLAEAESRGEARNREAGPGGLRELQGEIDVLR